MSTSAYTLHRARAALATASVGLAALAGYRLIRRAGDAADEAPPVPPTTDGGPAKPNDGD
jgi:hypothetical protein